MEEQSDAIRITVMGENADEFIDNLYSTIKEATNLNLGITAKHLDALAEQVKELAQRKKEIENDLGE